MSPLPLPPGVLVYVIFDWAVTVIVAVPSALLLVYYFHVQLILVRCAARALTTDEKKNSLLGHTVADSAARLARFPQGAR